MSKSNLKKATDSLKIHDIYLRDLVARSIDGFDPKYAPEIDGLVVQQMHIVREENVVALDDDAWRLRVFVRFGARWVNSRIENENLSVQAVIEAEFIAEYEMAEVLEQSCIDEFCLKNASFHIWPYWRELLSSQCERMHLPRLILPTIQLADNRHQQAEKHKG
jgi:preprotein translocase subunit SecB